jgi:hypothetical protein
MSDITWGLKYLDQWHGGHCYYYDPYYLIDTGIILGFMTLHESKILGPLTQKPFLLMCGFFYQYKLIGRCFPSLIFL